MLTSKQDFIEQFYSFINPLKKHYSTEGAFLNIGETGINYSYTGAKCEAFCRPLWAVVPFWYGGGSDPELEMIYRKGIIAGTNPESPEFWGHNVDKDQKFVEMSALAEAILFARDKIWDPLKKDEKDRFAKWLLEINHYSMDNNNWQYFGMMVNIALMSVDMPYNQKELTKQLNVVETFYLDEGWYRDSVVGPCDYYVPGIIQSFSLIYAHKMKDKDPIRCKRLIERAHQFAKTFLYWFSDEGEAIAYGRSLTYRMWQVAFWSFCVMTDEEVLPWGVIKGIISRNLEKWISKPITDNGGILTIGYGYPNIYMSENYNGPGSPYWGMMAYSLLGASKDHPFWQAECEPLPKMPKSLLIKSADMLFSRYNGNVTAYVPAKISHVIEHDYGYVGKYSKFAYSSRFGYSTVRNERYLNTAAPDSMLAFEIDGRIYTRDLSIEFKVDENKIYSKWSPYMGITVETTISLTDKGHKRHHVITSDKICKAFDCGFAVSIWDYENPEEKLEKDSATVINSYSGCKVSAKGHSGTPYIIKKCINTNLISPKTDIPTIEYKILEGTTVLDTEINEL